MFSVPFAFGNLVTGSSRHEKDAAQSLLREQSLLLATMLTLALLLGASYAADAYKVLLPQVSGLLYEKQHSKVAHAQLVVCRRIKLHARRLSIRATSW